MVNTKIGIEKINLYLLPLAAFFILISTAAVNFFLILAVFTAFIICIKNNTLGEIYQNDFFFKICFLIFFLFLISSFYSIADTNNIIETLKKYIKIIYIPFIYFYLQTYRNKKLVIRYFLIGTTFILLLSYIKYFNLINFEDFYQNIKFLSMTGIDQNIINSRSTVFQNYIIQGIVLSFYSFLCLYKAQESSNYFLYLLSILGFFHVIFINDSRTAYIIIFFLTLFSFYKVITNNKIRLIFFSIVIIIMTSNISNNFLNRVNMINYDINLIKSENYSSSIGKRFIWSKIGIENLLNEPILGNGVGSFKKSAQYYFKNYNIRIKSDSDFITNNPHSEFISISSQLGLIGLLSFFIFLYLLLINHGGPMSVVTFIIVFISSFFNSVFYDNVLGLFLIILISLSYKNKVKIKN
tara:strand:+ start:2535 stop:3764 length:1230 start_codon:yes stop_codon:yes gene_type:complete